MAILKQRLLREGTSGTFDTIHLETESGLVLRPDGTTIEDAITSMSFSPSSFEYKQIGTNSVVTSGTESVELPAIEDNCFLLILSCSIYGTFIAPYHYFGDSTIYLGCLLDPQQDTAKSVKHRGTLYLTYHKNGHATKIGHMTRGASTIGVSLYGVFIK